MSLAELIASGDEDAIAGFRDAHVDKVRAYCAVACGPDEVDDACEAAFVDFLGRALTTPDSERQLEELLLKATRSAAAARFRVPDAAPPPARPELCAATPELLAARANRELPADDHGLSAHLKHCARCRASAAQIERADAAFGASLGWEEPVTPAEPPMDDEPAPLAENPPLAEDPVAAEPDAPSPSPPSLSPALAPPIAPPPTTVRARRGGLVGAARRLGKQLGGGPGR